MRFVCSLKILLPSLPVIAAEIKKMKMAKDFFPKI